MDVVKKTVHLRVAVHRGILPSGHDLVDDGTTGPTSYGFPKTIATWAKLTSDAFAFVTYGGDESDSLVLPDGSFQISQEFAGATVLIGADGRQYHRGWYHDLLHGSGTDDLPWHRETAAERGVAIGGSKCWAPPLDDAKSSALSQLVARLTDRISRSVQILRDSQTPLTAKAFWRWLLRIAITVLRRILGFQRLRHSEAPEAITHSHSVDQYRIRAPGRTRRNLAMVLSGELAPI